MAEKGFRGMATEWASQRLASLQRQRPRFQRLLSKRGRKIFLASAHYLSASKTNNFFGTAIKPFSVWKITVNEESRQKSLSLKKKKKKTIYFRVSVFRVAYSTFLCCTLNCPQLQAEKGYATTVKLMPFSPFPNAPCHLDLWRLF